jgi:hypothetical protein
MISIELCSVWSRLWLGIPSTDGSGQTNGTGSPASSAREDQLHLFDTLRASHDDGSGVA